MASSSTRRKTDDTTPPDRREGSIPAPQQLFDRHRAMLAATTAPARRGHRARPGRRLLLPAAAVLGAVLVLAALLGLAPDRREPRLDVRSELIPTVAEPAVAPAVPPVVLE